MYLPGKVRVTETVGVAPAPSTLLIEFVADDGTVYDSSGPLPVKSGQPVSYGHLFAQVELTTQFEGLSVTPGQAGGKSAKGQGSTMVLGGAPQAPNAPKK